jgi:secretion/DNA translocation related TadE-like protein
VSRPDGSDRRDQGSATIWLVTAIFLVLFGLWAGIAVSEVTLARYRAGAAADAAALAAAGNALAGAAGACDQAGSLATLDGARVTACTLSGSVAEVAVAVRLPGPLAVFGSADGRARAGPASVRAARDAAGLGRTSELSTLKSLQASTDTPETDNGRRTKPAS